MNARPRPSRRPRAGILLVVCLLSACVFPARAQPAPRDPDTVKAAFLYRFTSFVQWPALEPAADDFTIAVLGADGVTGALARLLARYRVQGLPAQVRRIEHVGELGDARMLYVGRSYPGDLEPLIADLRGRPVLVVTDRGGALDDGSMVNFVVVERRIRFEISLAAAQAAGLKLGPGLLAVAVHVRGGPRSDRGCGPALRAPFDACPVRVAKR